MLTRRFIVWTALLAALAVGLCFVPLFDLLGFESSFVVGLVASFAAADLGADLVRRTRREAWPAGSLEHPVTTLFAGACLRGVALLVLPLAILLGDGVRVHTCDPWAGLVFYVALPGLSVILAAATGVVCGIVLGGRPRLAIACAWLFIVASILAGVWRFYAAPPVFGYDPFAGYFPGSIYDEDLTLPPAFFWARLYQLAIAMGALAVCAAWLDGRLRLRRGRPRTPPAVVAIVALTVGLVLSFERGKLGFAPSASDIAEALGGRIETPHFVIYYPRTASFASEMPEIAREHEFRWSQLAERFGVAPKEKITSFYFASAAEKARWMGAAQTYIAKPWRHEIYLQHEDFPHSAMRHEIAHVFAGEFGDPIFHVARRGLSFNVALIEGAAVAGDWPTAATMTPDQAMRALLDLHALPPVAAILGETGFTQFAPQKSYALAGSFCHFLLETYGPEKFRALYRSSGDFAGVYGVPLKELDAAWRERIAATPLTDDERAVAEDHYQRPGLFSRPCPHAIAHANTQAARLLAENQPADAIRVLQDICRDDPGDPEHRMALARALDRAGRLDEAEAIYRKIEAAPPVRAQALLALADLEGRRGELDDERATLADATKLPVDEGTRRNLQARVLALDDPTLGRYFYTRTGDGAQPDPVVLAVLAADVAAERTDGLGDYLEGRLVAGRGVFAEAARHLARAADKGLPGPLFARENDRLLVTAAFLAGDLDTARAAIDRLAAPDQPLAVRLDAEDWRQRLAFRALHP